MKKLVLIMAIVLMAGTAYGLTYADLGGTADPTDLHGFNEYWQQDGMHMNLAVPPAPNPING